MSNDFIGEPEEPARKEEEGDPEVPLIPKNAIERVDAQQAAPQANDAHRRTAKPFDSVWRIASTTKDRAVQWATARSDGFWPAIASAVATVVIALATIKYTQTTKQQWIVMKDQLSRTDLQLSEMQKQTTLISEQMEATQAAVVTVGYNDRRPELSITSIPPRPGDPKLSLWVNNSGHALARDVVVQIHFSRLEMPPKSTKIGGWSKEVKIGTLRPSEPGDPGKEIFFNSVVPQAEISNLLRTEETLHVEGSVSYLDGFNPKPMTDDFCYSYISYSIPHRDPKLIPANGSGFVQCYNFENEVAVYRQRKAEVAKEWPEGQKRN